jgi:hypothetical protein
MFWSLLSPSCTLQSLNQPSKYLWLITHTHSTSLERPRQLSKMSLAYFPFPLKQSGRHRGNILISYRSTINIFYMAKKASPRMNMSNNFQQLGKKFKRLTGLWRFVCRTTRWQPRGFEEKEKISRNEIRLLESHLRIL